MIFLSVLKMCCDLSTRMVAGDFPETVMKAVDKYVPKSNCLLYSNHLKSEEHNKSYLSTENSVTGAEESLLG